MSAWFILHYCRRCGAATRRRCPSGAARSWLDGLDPEEITLSIELGSYVRDLLRLAVALGLSCFQPHPPDTAKERGSPKRRRSCSGITTGASLRKDACGPTSIFLFVSEGILTERPASYPSRRTRLRLHRKYSIKLMLAWGTCCRIHPLSSLPSITVCMPLTRGLCLLCISPRFWHPVHVPSDLNDCRSPGSDRVRLCVGATAASVWLGRTHHPTEVPRGVRSYGMDAPAIWNRHGAVSGSPHVREACIYGEMSLTIGQ